MKTLNRPMFRYGGPIKEGIMTGMQERPGYKKAGIVSGILSKIPGGQSVIDYSIKSNYCNPIGIFIIE